MDKAARRQAFRMAQDLDNLQMIPGVENQSKNASFDGAEQTRLFDVCNYSTRSEQRLAVDGGLDCLKG
jgi:hypothetical protein